MSENDGGFVRAVVVKLLGRLEGSLRRVLELLLSDPEARAALVAGNRGAVLSRVEVDGPSFALVLEPKELLDALTETPRCVVLMIARLDCADEPAPRLRPWPGSCSDER